MKSLNLVIAFSFLVILASCQTLGEIIASNHHGAGNHPVSHQTDDHMPSVYGGRAREQHFYDFNSAVYIDINTLKKIRIKQRQK